MREIYIHFYVQQTLWAQIMNKKTEKKKKKALWRLVSL